MRISRGCSGGRNGISGQVERPEQMKRRRQQAAQHNAGDDTQPQIALEKSQNGSLRRPLDALLHDVRPLSLLTPTEPPPRRIGRPDRG